MHTSHGKPTAKGNVKIINIHDISDWAVSEAEVNIGLIRLVMKKQGVQLADELNRFLAVEPLSPKDAELDEEDLKSALAELERV